MTVGLSRKVAPLIRISAAVASRDALRLREALEGAVAADARAVEETLLQTHLFVGFPIALEALILWREVCGSPPPRPLHEDAGSWAGRGALVCERVYGANYPKLRANVQAIHPDLDRWMVEGGYGRVIGRPGLDLPTRELCIAALLIVWDAPRQLHSHVRGALNAGASGEDLTHTLQIAGDYASPDSMDGARELLSRILNR